VPAVLRPIHWGGDRTLPPPDTPRCGFDGRECLEGLLDALLCLSNAMHGQNINLPVYVCVCVCVRHTFCQLAYRSDPSTDFLQLIA